MRVIIDSTVLIHMSTQYNRMVSIMDAKGITEYCITRVNYIELLAGASVDSKPSVRKFLQKYPVLEFDAKAIQLANNLAMRYRVGKKQSKDFFIAAIAIANKLATAYRKHKRF